MELASPITIYWDLPFGAKNTEFQKQIGTEILECRPLMLQLYFPDLRPDDGHLELVELFAGTHIAVSLTVPIVFINKLVVNAGLKELLVSVDRLEDVAQLLNLNVPAFSGISFFVSRENWRQLPELVQFCRKNGICRLVLPMQRLLNNEVPFYISRLEQRELDSALAEAGGSKGIDLTIHDPFLWRAFNPDLPFPQAGCQAANTMISIDPVGNVYPCPALPVRLGTVGNLSLKEIIDSAAKKEFRHNLLETPVGCRECVDVPECRGGCRGRALVLHASLGAIDSACQ